MSTPAALLLGRLTSYITAIGTTVTEVDSKTQKLVLSPAPEVLNGLKDKLCKIIIHIIVTSLGSGSVAFKALGY